jgi:hypothetical protein
MKKRALVAPLLFFPLLTLFTLPAEAPPWGFFGHRRINRLAVFTLPAEMAVFYKQHIEYLTDHAVDPDKRRYATRHEAVRHYIDLDHWGGYPFEETPRDWVGALAKYATVSMATEQGDTVALIRPGPRRADGQELDDGNYRRFFSNTWLPQYYDDAWTCSCDSMRAFLQTPLSGCREVFATDSFSAYGILPYHLLAMQQRLTRAFEEGDPDKIIRLSTEMGHYIGDAHVPLHTTENYNGQLTGQEGIHAFWESRLPELFADARYDYFVGPASYIGDPAGYYWDIVLDSHLLLDSVLGVEWDLRRHFPSDQQYCYDERLGQTVRTQCERYAEAYHERLDGQVEARMRAAILAIGSAWYTAWTDAGSPDLRRLGAKEAPAPEEEKLPPSKAPPRPHE